MYRWYTLTALRAPFMYKRQRSYLGFKVRKLSHRVHFPAKQQSLSSTEANLKLANEPKSYGFERRQTTIIFFDLWICRNLMKYEEKLSGKQTFSSEIWYLKYILDLPNFLITVEVGLNNVHIRALNFIYLNFLRLQVYNNNGH